MGLFLLHAGHLLPCALLVANFGQKLTTMRCNHGGVSRLCLLSSRGGYKGQTINSLQIILSPLIGGQFRVICVFFYFLYVSYMCRVFIYLSCILMLFSVNRKCPFSDSDFCIICSPNNIVMLFNQATSAKIYIYLLILLEGEVSNFHVDYTILQPETKHINFPLSSYTINN